MKKIPASIALALVILAGCAKKNTIAYNPKGDQGPSEHALSIEEIRSTYEKEKSSFLRDPLEVQRLMNSIIQDIKENNRKYRVELTEAMKYRIAEITGAVPPSDMNGVARVQWGISSKKWDKYMKSFEKIFGEEKNQKYQKEEKKIDDREKEIQKENKRIEEEKRVAEQKKREAERLKKIEEQKRIEEEQKKRAEEQKRLDDELKKMAEEKKHLEEQKKSDIDDIPSYLAESFTWLDRNRVTPVKYQGMCGSCWAFTAAAVFEANYLIKNSVSLDLSEQFIIDCAKDDKGRRAGSCGGGWYGSVFDYFEKENPETEEKNPYKTKDSFCKPVISAGDKKYSVAAWGYVRRDAGIPTVEEMKKALCKYGPLASSVKVTPAFQAYAGGVFNEFAPVNGENDVNHAIVIVGWDDSKKAYLVKNSWGEHWGEKGYVWVEYGCNNIGFGTAWIAVEQVR